jgi:uncharacterized protein
MTSVIIVPGLGGSGDTHWQTHLQRSLPDATRVQQDDWEKPELKGWLERLAAEVEARPGAILVAHSLGCALVAHLALRRPRPSINGALLVAPADVDSNTALANPMRSFAPMPLRPFPFRSIVVASTNDPYIGIERAFDLAGAWGAEFINIGPAGHINIAAGFGPWIAAKDMVDSLIEPSWSRSPTKSNAVREFAMSAKRAK